MNKLGFLVTSGYYIAFVVFLAMIGFKIDEIVTISMVCATFFGAIYCAVSGEKLHREI